MTPSDPTRDQRSDSAGPAYRSSLTISFGHPAKDPAPWLTATATDGNDSALRELRRRAVDPVVTSLLGADELEQTTVYRPAGTREIRVWITAGGEEFHEVLASPEQSAAE